MTRQSESGSGTPTAKPGSPSEPSSIVETSESPGDTGQKETGTGGVNGSPGIAHGEPPTTRAEVSNTENVFPEEQTEGFNRAPTGSGDLEENG